MAVQISVIIPCKNEVPNIDACVDSVLPFADEVLVADSGSEDGTVDLVKQRGDCRLIERAEYVCHSNFSNWAIPQASHDWIFLVDADERISPELAAELNSLKQAALEETPYDAFRMTRQNYFKGQRIRFSGWQRDKVRRLFRQTCRFDQRRTHSDLDVSEEKTGNLKSVLIHHTFRTFAHFWEKNSQYAERAALDMHQKGRRSSLLQMMFRPAYRFFRQYIIQGGFLDGKAGVIIAGVAASYVFSKHAILWELERNAESSTLKINGTPVETDETASEQRKAG